MGATPEKLAKISLQTMLDTVCDLTNLGMEAMNAHLRNRVSATFSLNSVPLEAVEEVQNSFSHRKCLQTLQKKRIAC